MIKILILGQFFGPEMTYFTHIVPEMSLSSGSGKLLEKRMLRRCHDWCDLGQFMVFGGKPNMLFPFRAFRCCWWLHVVATMARKLMRHLFWRLLIIITEKYTYAFIVMIIRCGVAFVQHTRWYWSFQMWRKT